MKQIWKFPIDVGPQEIKMPKGADVLTVQMQGNTPCLWALVDIEAEKELRVFNLVGTGHICRSLKDNYIGTFQMGPLVWHLFEEKR